MYAPVKVYDVMVSDVREASCEMPFADVGGSYVASGWCGRAVDDDGVDFSHGGVCLLLCVMGFSAKLVHRNPS